ncbi:restriction endonuclease subunit S [Leuconostoc lactis]|uniref:restriction endonuclease subunit S n=1 Tax=Leuconostoc lactis TaxID=1246 RepID=UPI0028A80938|nr:restriction endonuclease subunit S [Leuconostoc lactis]
MKTVKLSDVLIIKYGKDHKNLDNGNIPVYGSGGLMRMVDNYLYDGESVLIPRKGSLNNVQFVSGKFWTVDTLFWTIINSNLIRPKYLYYILKQLNFLSMNVGSAVPSLTASILYPIEITIPSLEIQDKILLKILPIESKIYLNKQINDNLVELAIAMFKEMFPHIQYGDNQIGDYITPKRGKNLTSKNAVIGKIPVIAGGLSPATWHNQANTKKPVITISASGANAGFVNLWTIPVWSSDSSYIDSTMTDTPYFWYIMLKVRQSEIFDLQTGSAQPHIYPKHIAGLPTIKLTLANMKKYENRVIPIFDEYANNLSEINTLSNLRDTLLPKLLNGEIEFN